MTIQVYSDYLRSVFNPNDFVEKVEKAASFIGEFNRKTPFDAIAFTGQSGAAMAYPLSYLLKLPLICVRKSANGTHSSRRVEGCYNVERYIIVDDVSFSGRTIKRIKKNIDQLDYWVSNKMPSPVCIGIYLYNHHLFYIRNVKNVGDLIHQIPIIGTS